MEGICRMEDGQTHPYVCRSIYLSPSTVSTIMKSADKIQQSVQHATTVSAMQVIAEANFKKKMEKLLSLWVDDFNKKKQSVDSSCYY